MNTAHTATKPTLNRIADWNGMEQYEVTMNGEVIGTVGQHEATTVTRYSGSAVGRRTSRKAWEWTAAYGGGNSELSSRAKAVRELVEDAQDNA